MKYTIFISLLLLFASCQSTVKYRSIKESRKSHSSKQYARNGNLESVTNTWLGVPYKYGGMSRRGVDCSGFTTVIYEDIYEKKLPRTARDQYLNGQKISFGSIKAGDLVFFRGVLGHGIDHVGIYLENGDFIHASTSKGVIISNLAEDYYDSRFVGVCRY